MINPKKFGFFILKKLCIFLKKNIMSIISEQIRGKVINVEIQSSNIKFASFNTENKTLTITFNNGTIYEYYNFSWEIFAKFRMAESQGKFFNTEINGKYEYKKVEPEVTD
jgi:hypothetical protein